MYLCFGLIKIFIELIIVLNGGQWNTLFQSLFVIISGSVNLSPVSRTSSLSFKRFDHSFDFLPTFCVVFDFPICHVMFCFTFARGCQRTDLPVQSPPTTT